MPIMAPPASASTAIVPRSPTAIGSTNTWPPLALATSTVFSASSTARYTDHTSGMPSSWAVMSPATVSPSSRKLV